MKTMLEPLISSDGEAREPTEDDIVELRPLPFRNRPKSALSDTEQEVSFLMARARHFRQEADDLEAEASGLVKATRQAQQSRMEPSRTVPNVDVGEIATDCGYFILNFSIFENSLSTLCLTLQPEAKEPYSLRESLETLSEDKVYCKIDHSNPGLLEFIKQSFCKDGVLTEWRDCIAHGVIVDVYDGEAGRELTFRKRLKWAGDRQWFHLHIPQTELKQASIDLVNLISTVHAVTEALAAAPNPDLD